MTAGDSDRTRTIVWVITAQSGGGLLRSPVGVIMTISCPCNSRISIRSQQPSITLDRKCHLDLRDSQRNRTQYIMTWSAGASGFSSYNRISYIVVAESSYRITYIYIFRGVPCNGKNPLRVRIKHRLLIHWTTETTLVCSPMWIKMCQRLFILLVCQLWRWLPKPSSGETSA